MAQLHTKECWSISPVTALVRSQDSNFMIVISMRLPKVTQGSFRGVTTVVMGKSVPSFQIYYLGLYEVPKEQN